MTKASEFLLDLCARHGADWYFPAFERIGPIAPRHIISPFRRTFNESPGTAETLLTQDDADADPR